MVSVEAPCALPLLFQVDIGRIRRCGRIEARMLEKALVLGRNDGIDESLRNFLKSHDAALLAVAVERLVMSSGSRRYWVRSVLSVRK